MALFSGLDIPSELEALFNALLSIGNNSTSLGSRPVVSSGDTLKKRVLYTRSLFVLWQDLYNGFDSDRKAAWQTYWATLPFGDHGGSNGWPGSGYSAFVYVNAPIYKVGGDLLLDPPSLNLIVDPTFITTPSWWDFEDTGDWIQEFGFARCTGGTNGLFSGIYSSDGGTYRLQLDVSNSNDGNMRIYDPSNTPFIYDEPLYDGHFDVIKHFRNAGGQLVLEQNGWTGDITNVVLIRIG